MSKRLFVAVNLDQDSLKKLGKYRDAMGRQTPFFRWIAINNLHITLIFLGDIAENNIAPLSTELKQIADETKKFSLRFSHPIYAPPNLPTSMIWVRMRDSNEFKILTQSIHMATEKLTINNNFRLENIPHITLARIKSGAIFHRLPKLGRTGLEETELNINGFELVESRLTPAGPIYKTVETYNFKQ